MTRGRRMSRGRGRGSDGEGEMEEMAREVRRWRRKVGDGLEASREAKAR